MTTLSLYPKLCLKSFIYLDTAIISPPRAIWIEIASYLIKLSDIVHFRTVCRASFCIAIEANNQKLLDFYFYLSIF